MDMIMAITIISTIIWYIVDRFKDLWTGQSFSKYITIAAVGILAIACVFSFGLDLIFALGLTAGATIIGKVMTVLALMTGSSAISEIISRVKGKQPDQEQDPVFYLETDEDEDTYLE